jgi:hypothetical protein
MNFALRKSEFYLTQCKSMLKTKESSYQLAAARQSTASSLIPYPSEAELQALLGDKPKAPKIKTNLAAWTRLFPAKTQDPDLPSYWRHDSWREMFERKQQASAAALNKVDEFSGVSVVGTKVVYPAQESKFSSSQASVKRRPATATTQFSLAKCAEVKASKPSEYSVKSRTLNLQSWDMPDEHHVNLGHRVDSTDAFGKKNFYYAFDPDKPDEDYLDDLDMQNAESFK